MIQYHHRMTPHANDRPNTLIIASIVGVALVGITGLGAFVYFVTQSNATSVGDGSSREANEYARALVRQNEIVTRYAELQSRIVGSPYVGSEAADVWEDNPEVAAGMIWAQLDEVETLLADARTDAELAAALGIVTENGEPRLPLNQRVQIRGALAHSFYNYDLPELGAEQLALAIDAYRAQAESLDPSVTQRILNPLAEPMRVAERADEYLAMVEDLAARWSPEPGTEAWERLIHTHAGALNRVGRSDEAEDLYRPLVERLIENEDGRGTRWQLENMARTIADEQPRLAARLWEEIINRMNADETPGGNLQPWNNAGALYEQAGDIDRGLAFLEEGLTLTREDPDRHSDIRERMLVHYGSVLTRLGRLDDARAALDEADDLNAMSGNERNRRDIDTRRQRLAQARQAAADAP